MSKGHSPRRYNVARYDRNRARIRWRKRRTVVDEIEALIDNPDVMPDFETFEKICESAGIGGKRKTNGRQNETR